MDPEIIIIAVAVLQLIMVFAQVKLFEINKTLKSIETFLKIIDSES